jgi:hypothetical protein
MTPLLAVAASVPQGDETASGWEALTRLLVREADRNFALATRTEPSREAALGRALAQSQLAPVTEGSVERAKRMLEDLRQSDRDDEVGIAAGYALARLLQFHPYHPDAAGALVLYRELHERHPAHELGQLAMVKSAMIRLFESSGTADAARVFAELVEQVPAVTHPAVRRDFHLTLAGAAQLLGLPQEIALEHLLAAAEIGVNKRKTAGDLYVRIATMAERLGRREVAIAYHRRFVAEFPRDNRTFLCRLRLRGLEGEKSFP